MDNYFSALNAINVNDKTEKKNNLTYLSWAWAWGELKERHPDAVYTVYETPDGINYFHDGKTAWVKTGVTVCGIEHIEYLPVMDFRNSSITIDKITSFDVNKAIQRSLTKAVARHGLGLYIYAGEDLPEDDKPDKTKPEPAAPKNSKPAAVPEPRYATPQQVERLRAIYTGNNLDKLLEANKIAFVNELPRDKADQLIRKYDEKQEARNGTAAK